MKNIWDKRMYGTDQEFFWLTGQHRHEYWENHEAGEIYWSVIRGELTMTHMLEIVTQEMGNDPWINH